jgi:hypothetical protein
MMEVETAASTPATVPVEQLNSDQRDKWLLDGTLPTVEAKPEASSTSDAPKVELSESAPDSETGKPSAEAAAGEKKPKNAESRIQELVAERRAEKERADRLESELAALKSGKKPDVKAEAEPSTALKAPEKPKRPKLEEFEHFEQYEAAQETYDTALVEYAEQLADHKAEVKQAEAKAKAEAEEADKSQKQLAAELNKKIDKAIERHPDFKEKLRSAKHLGNIREGSLVDRAILGRELGAEMLYHFATNEADLTRILALDAIDQGAELKKLESQLSKAGTSAPTKVSSAPGPLTEVGGKGATPEDESLAALKADDFRAWKRAEDAKDIAKRKS